MNRFAFLLGAMVLLSGCAADRAQQPEPTPAPGSGPYTAEQLAELYSAISRLDWLLGRWKGEGFVRSILPGAEPVSIQTVWEIQKRYDGRFLELSFTNAREGGRRDHWVGYFTWDVEADEYVTVWLNPGNAYQFRERGTLSAEDNVLTLVSTQEGPRDTRLTVRSVFMPLLNGFKVEDTTQMPGEEPIVTFSFSVTRLYGG